MGLLDQFSGLGNLDESQTQGLLAAAAQMLQQSGPSRTPTSLGQVLGGGMEAYQNTMVGQKKRKLQEDEARQMMAMRGMQMQGLESDQAIKTKQRERMERIRSALTPGAAPAPLDAMPPTPQPMIAPSPNEPSWMTDYRQTQGAQDAPRTPSPAPGNAGAGTQALIDRLTQAAQVYAAEGDIEGSTKLLEQAAKFRAKFNTTPQVVRGQNGKPMHVLVNDEGVTKEMPYGVAEKLNFQDIGGSTVGLDVYTGDTVSRVKNSQSPNNIATVGASYANAAATREIAGATRDAARITRDMNTEMKMGDDYRTQSKGFKEAGEAYRTINATLDKATISPAATLASATKFMKLLDPGSVVRESELGMALAASGVFDRATNYYQTLLKGRVLTPNQVADFKSITGQIYGAAQAGQQAIDQSYRKQAETYGLRPDMVVQDLGQNKKVNPNAMTEMPKANASNKGRLLKDDETGKQYRSNGLQWMEVK